jgi:hypothetical protein
MLRKDSLTVIAQPVPELPVADVELAQRHYRDVWGFEIAWTVPDPDGRGSEIGAVKRGDVVIFLRRRSPPFEPAVHWVFAGKLRDTYDEMRSLGAIITDPLEKKPWGITQFTVEDVDGNRFYFHCD